MKKALLLFAFVCFAFAGNAQNNSNPFVNYEGYWTIPTNDSDAYKAFRSQQLVDNQRSVDTISKQRYDRYVSGSAYDSSVREIGMLLKAKKRDSKSDPDMVSYLEDYYTLQNAIKHVVINNQDYRRFMYRYNGQVLMVIKEPWGADQNVFTIVNALINTSAHVRLKAVDDEGMRDAFATVNSNQRYLSCRYTIVVHDTIMSSKPEVYICDRLHYNIAKTRYKLDDGMLGVPKDYRNRKLESSAVKGYLRGSMSLRSEPNVFTVIPGEHVGERYNTAIIDINQLPNWYVLIFSKGILCYVNSFPSCNSVGSNIYVPYNK